MGLYLFTHNNYQVNLPMCLQDQDTPRSCLMYYLSCHNGIVHNPEDEVCPANVKHKQKQQQEVENVVSREHLNNCGCFNRRPRMMKN